MKMNYSNAMIVNHLTSNYQLKQNVKSSNSNYLIAGILTGIVVGGVIVYFIQYNHTQTIISNIRKQNLKLRLENESQRIAINGFSNQSFVKPESDTSISNQNTKIENDKNSEVNS